MFENIMNIFKKLGKKEGKQSNNSRDAAKERLHLVLMQDRANVSADFLELMKQEIIEVIKKYIDVDEREIDVRLTNKENGDGTNGAPALYANIPILNIKNESRKVEIKKEDAKNEKNIEKQDKSNKEQEVSKKEEVKDETSKQNKEKLKTADDNKEKDKEKDKNKNTEKTSDKKEQKSVKTKEKIKSEN